MKYLFKILFILLTSFLIKLTVISAEVDEERYTSGGQWEISSENKGFIKYTEQEKNLRVASDDNIDGRSFFDQKDTTNSHQIHTVYILASDSKDKKLDVNGTIKKILQDSNNLL